MATMIPELYDALKAAGAPDDKARKAAEVVAGYENQFVSIRADIASLRSELSERINAVRSELSDRITVVEGKLVLVQWMLGFNLAATVGIIMLLLRR
jgi:hypothetical protein